ncbi:glycosyltransferase [Joostella atrarenae]|uniref:Glycosyltransferase n=1 Tax=Joostella atrarenae TaxID=679257 RepID=A0ABS9J376_9FLAO|nr:glycosyltransferase [Joostella atrarenae]MCF8714887.1 glycosyltransferase [Joostella atrarenae]
MKILIIAPINSIHTIRWINGLVNHVDELHIASSHKLIDKIDDRIIFHKLKYKAPLGYLLNYNRLRRIIEKQNYDLIHTHFLSGYGTLSFLSVNIKKNRHILSMWGSDIYDFPNKSFLHKELIWRVTKNATVLTSTSNVMKEQYLKLYNYPKEKIKVVPFGVDIDLFTGKAKENSDKYTIGIAKNIETKYGIQYLIEGFKILNDKYHDAELHIIGDGSLLNEMKNLSKSLGVDENVIFHGRVRNELLPKYMYSWDVCVIPSIMDSESFGVSAVEASACSLPVIASNVGGLPEVVQNDKSGIIIPAKNSQAIADELEYLYLNPDILKKMGLAGRKIVEDKYNWDNNVKEMYHIYLETIKNQIKS